MELPYFINNLPLELKHVKTKQVRRGCESNTTNERGTPFQGLESHTCRHLQILGPLASWALGVKISAWYSAPWMLHSIFLPPTKSSNRTPRSLTRSLMERMASHSAATPRISILVAMIARQGYGHWSKSLRWPAFFCGGSKRGNNRSYMGETIDSITAIFVFRS